MRKKPTIIDLFYEHVRVCSNMATWAYSADESLKAGKVAKAKRDLATAMKWKARKDAIEAEADRLLRELGDPVEQARKAPGRRSRR
jgi:hypothetical protein